MVRLYGNLLAQFLATGFGIHLWQDLVLCVGGRLYSPAESGDAARSAGAGAVEAVITTLAVKEDLIPPTINYEYKDPQCDLDYVPNRMREQRVDYALSNSFGFGGQNSCILIKKYTG